MVTTNVHPTGRMDASTADVSLVEADFTIARIGVRPLTAFVILFVALVVSIVGLLVLLLLVAIAGILDRCGRRDVWHVVYWLGGGDRRVRSRAGTRWHISDCGQHASRLHL